MTIQTALAQLRHLYAQMLTWSDGAANCALGLLGPAIAALEVGTERVESDLVKTTAELVACEKERDAMKVALEDVATFGPGCNRQGCCCMSTLDIAKDALVACRKSKEPK